MEYHDEYVWVEKEMNRMELLEREYKISAHDGIVWEAYLLHRETGETLPEVFQKRQDKLFLEHAGRMRKEYREHGEGIRWLKTRIKAMKYFIPQAVKDVMKRDGVNSIKQASEIVAAAIEKGMEEKLGGRPAGKKRLLTPETVRRYYYEEKRAKS